MNTETEPAAEQRHAPSEDAHFIVTILLDVSATYLRVASVIIPIPFGMALYTVNKIHFRGAAGFGSAVAFLSVTAMLVVVGFVDRVPILPEFLAFSPDRPPIKHW